MSLPHVAILLADLNAGGVQHMARHLAAGLGARGARVTFLVCEPGGRLEEDLPQGATLRHLPSAGLAGRLAAFRAAPSLWRAMLHPFLLSPRRSRTVPRLPALAGFLRSERPDALFTATPFLNVEALLANRLAGGATRVVLSERTHFSSGKAKKRWRLRRLAPLMGAVYPWAHAVVAVSKGVADDVARSTGLDRDRLTVLHNPVLLPGFTERAAERADHPWFAKGGPPVVLAIGRPTRQKDFDTLVRAFAMLRARRPARLVVIGESATSGGGGGGAAALLTLAGRLGVAGDVALLGYKANPLPYLRRAALFALSSRYEGFGNVLVEALACGTPIVSTDCPSGPAEILEGGRYGRLVPVGDAGALAAAMALTLDAPPDPATLRERAAHFGYERSMAGYARLLLPDEAGLDAA
ncbi:MAG: glycosyltransferase [Geminicoccaceae bacterium]|nr:glycosyltransferase [Geminicoccaceae bacterium]